MRPLLLASLLLLASCGRERRPAALWAIPAFEISRVTPSSVEPFGLSDMRGKVWVADFVFTRCGGPCPVLTTRLSALGRRLPPAVGLLTVTVDPKGDTPERLRAYARAHGADLERWVFARGDVPRTYDLLYSGFRLPVSTRPEKGDAERVVHSTYFVLVDAEGRVRGYYDAFDDAAQDALVRDAQMVLEVGS